MSHPHDRLVTHILNQILMVGMESSEASEKKAVIKLSTMLNDKARSDPFPEKWCYLRYLHILLRVYHRNLRRCAGFPSPRQVRRANGEEEDLETPTELTQGSQQVRGRHLAQPIPTTHQLQSLKWQTSLCDSHWQETPNLHPGARILSTPNIGHEVDQGWTNEVPDAQN